MQYPKCSLSFAINRSHYSFDFSTSANIHIERISCMIHNSHKVLQELAEKMEKMAARADL